MTKFMLEILCFKLFKLEIKICNNMVNNKCSQ